MPAVKKLYQHSANNSKPEYLFGHSFQAIGLLVTGALGDGVRRAHQQPYPRRGSLLQP